MSKPKKSGSAVFMYCVIALTAAAAVSCFVLYYGNVFKNSVILWTGVTAFTIMYHFWLRIILGTASKLLRIDYRQRWFKERRFEKGIYKFLRVKKWKDKVLTYNPELFSLENRTLEEIANTMAKAELDHWINEIVSLVSLLFALIWGEFWIFLIAAVAAMIFDAQFIVIQRYNRPRVVRILERADRRCCAVG